MQRSLTTIITDVNKLVSVYWPLQSFIATNPLWDMTDHNFADLCEDLSPHMSLCMERSFYEQAYYNHDITDADLVEAINKLGWTDETTTWLNEAYYFIKTSDTTYSQPITVSEQLISFDYKEPVKWLQQKTNFWLLQYFGELTQSTPSPTISLFDYWQNYIIREYQALAVLQKFDDPLTTIEFLIQQLDIPEQALNSYLTQIICYQYGWASLIKWTQQRPDNPWIPPQADLASLICIWLSYEWLMCQYVRPPKLQFLHDDKNNLPSSIRKSTQLSVIWQLAYEHHQHQQLIHQLQAVNPPNHNQSLAADAQFIFCIDVRSEAIRRHIEALGPYETYGFAGFFGFAFKLADEHNTRYQCPALLDPQTVIQNQSTMHNLIQQTQSALTGDIEAAKQHVSSPYALFEMVGVYKIFKLIRKTFLNQRPADTTHYDQPEINTNALSLNEAAQAGYQLLNTIGLTEHFAEDIILCAHQSINDNNPFSAALDCGACGGNSGIPNAKVAAAYLNHPQVRQQIAQMGINIPQATTFIAGCHYTAYDEIQLFDTPRNGKLPNILQRACIKLRAEKSGHFIYHENNQLLKKQNDWAELVPELGLANNCALIIGPRRLTKNMNLQGRVFLHSYEPHLDPRGDILANIVAAPVIVAHWINAQYYFSTVAPQQFGAGNKAIHNVIPNIGVMEGNLSDLKIGLPLQSISYKDQLIHQPVKLLVIIYGNQSVVDEVIQHNPTVKNLIDHNWITLQTIACNN